MNDPAYSSNPEAAERWPPAYIIAELMTRKTSIGEYIADGPYEWSRQAVLYVREAYKRGETLCAYAAKWCQPGDPYYEAFNERWERYGRPVLQEGGEHV